MRLWTRNDDSACLSCDYVCGAAIPANVHATPVGKWNLVVAASDEFDGSTLDAAKWKKGLWYDTSGVLAFRQENIAVSGGNLLLTARKEAFNERSYTLVLWNPVSMSRV